MWKEFRPALKFLFVFVGLYLAGNIIYGLIITAYGDRPDGFTSAVASQTSTLLHIVGRTVDPVLNTAGPTVFLKQDGRTVLNVYEGCNGINVMIVFVAFVAAFGGSLKRMSWFLPAGILVIHLANLVRIALLYFVAVGYQHYFYYVHKYVFTAILYIITFMLWYYWVTKINGRPKATAAA